MSTPASSPSDPSSKTTSDWATYPSPQTDFAGWLPEVIRNDPVLPEELEGYAIWREAADEGTAGVWDWYSDKPKLGERIRRFLGRR
jgi:hypothetical protein